MISEYEARAGAHAARRDAEMRVSLLISRCRLATFLPGAALVVFSLTREGAPWALAAGGILLSAFAILVVWHARVDARVAWYEALYVVNHHAVARVARAWDRLPPAEPPHVFTNGPQRNGSSRARQEAADLEHHPYAIDLDLFGRASLMQWLGPLGTASGTMTLQRWLLHPAAPAEIARRQPAVAELAGALDWREQLAAHGRLVADVRMPELERFLAWAESGGSFTPAQLAALRIAVWSITAAIWLTIALQASLVTDAALWLIPVVLGLVLSFATAWRVHGEFNRAGGGQQAFGRYADLFAHATAAPSSTPALQEIQSRLTTAGVSAPDSMRRLNRILGFASLRAGAAIFHFPIQALTLWDFHVFFALDRWRRSTGSAIRDWMTAVGELDALSALSRVKADNPEWGFPEVTGALAERTFRATQLGHPLLHHERRIANDVEVGPPGTILLITGSNMSGKSTLLRSIGLNVVLAHAGAPACASSLAMPPIDLETSLRVHDSLEQGLSYFMAALARLKGVVGRAQHPREGWAVMYLLDEVLQGTNTAERAVAVRAVARQLLRSGAIGTMTTHDLAIAAEEPFKSSARLAHFSDTVDEHGAMSFDYRLRSGLATSRNALRLMHLIGIEVEE